MMAMEFAIAPIIFTILLTLGTFLGLQAESKEKPEMESIYLGPARSYVCPSDGVFPHETGCEFYYKCKDGKADLLNCDPTVHRLFNEQESFCDHAMYVECGSRIRPPNVPDPVPKPTTTTQKPTTSLKPITTTTPPVNKYNCTSNGAFPHPIHCEMYFDCWYGLSTLLRCANGTLFDTEYFGCKNSAETECQERLRPHFYCPDYQDRYYQDPRNCAGFFRCVDGISTHYLCPDNLLFNSALSVCDFTENVICGTRIKWSHL